MTEQELLTRIDRFIAENEAQLFTDLKTLIDINSVRGEAAPAHRLAKACAAPWMPRWKWHAALGL